MRRIVTLLTDFGTADGYVGEMKGVLLSAPRPTSTSSTSRTRSRRRMSSARGSPSRGCGADFRRERFTSWSSIRASDVRAPVSCVESDGRFLVGPDNGVLSPALLLADPRASSSCRYRQFGVGDVSWPRRVRARGRGTRARRDARVARATDVDLRSSAARRSRRAEADGELEGEVILIDRFGNACHEPLRVRGGDGRRSGRVRSRYDARMRMSALARRSPSWVRLVSSRSRSAMGMPQRRFACREAPGFRCEQRPQDDEAVRGVLLTTRPTYTAPLSGSIAPVP